MRGPGPDSLDANAQSEIAEELVEPFDDGFSDWPEAEDSHEGHNHA